MEALGSNDLSKIKIIFLGSSGVGKTTVITKFIDKCFVESNIPTIGIDFTGRTVFVDGRPVRVQIWDTAGQERFHSLIPSYIREARGAVVMFDLTRRDSFAEVCRWVDLARSKSSQNLAVVLCGNKCDKEDREIHPDEVHKICEDLNVSYIETSAKAGKNINYLFETITRQAMLQPAAEKPAWEEAVRLNAQPTPTPPPKPKPNVCYC